MFQHFNQSDGEDAGGVTVSSRLFVMVMLGFLLVFIGVIVLVVASVFSGESGSVGGVVFIGPIPIVFGGGS